MIKIENNGSKKEEVFNWERQMSTLDGVTIWGLLHSYGLRQIQELFCGAMPVSFDLAHEIGASDWRSDLTERELHHSFLECPDAWFYIFYACRKLRIKTPLVDDFHKACKRLVAEKVLPDLTDLMDADAKVEEFELVEVTEAQHRKAAIVVGIAADLLRSVLGTRLAEVNELQKLACAADPGPWGPRVTKRR